MAEISFINSFFLSGALSYVIIGYALAFGSGSSWIGWTGFAMIGIPFADYAYVFFQVNIIFRQI